MLEKINVRGIASYDDEIKELKEITSKIKFVNLFLKYKNGFEEKCPTY